MLILYKYYQQTLGIFQCADFIVTVFSEAQPSLKRTLNGQYFPGLEEGSMEIS